MRQKRSTNIYDLIIVGLILAALWFAFQAIAASPKRVVIQPPVNPAIITAVAPPAIAPATAVPIPPVNAAPADTTNQAAAVYNENPALANDCMAAAVAGRRMSPQCADVISRMGQGR